jgi:limonene-1,2-epoxide hydrolase
VDGDSKSKRLPITEPHTARDAASGQEHPFVAAFRTRDLRAWSAHFAPEIRLFSPIFTATFDGKARAIELYEVLFSSLSEFDVVRHARTDQGDVFWWRCVAAGRRIEGTDLISYRADGRISEIRVMIRTLPALASFALAVGPPLAHRRGGVRYVLALALTWPLVGIFALADSLGPRLILDRGAPTSLPGHSARDG